MDRWYRDAHLTRTAASAFEAPPPTVTPSPIGENPTPYMFCGGRKAVNGQRKAVGKVKERQRKVNERQ